MDTERTVKRAIELYKRKAAIEEELSELKAHLINARNAGADSEFYALNEKDKIVLTPDTQRVISMDGLINAIGADEVETLLNIKRMNITTLAISDVPKSVTEITGVIAHEPCTVRMLCKPA
jgi:hypothetical protein